MTESAKPAWGEFITTAQMWFCGDDCYCTEPRIIVSGPNRIAGSPWWRHVTIWQGTFHTEATMEEREQQDMELMDEARLRGIPMESDTFGTRRPNAEEMALFDLDEAEHREYLAEREVGW